MTNGSLENNAKKFNQRFVILQQSLMFLAMCAGTGGVVAILDNHETAAIICALVAIASFAYAIKIPYATSKKAILSSYIRNLLEKASEQKRLKLAQELQMAEISHRFQTQKMDHLQRSREVIRDLPVDRLIAKNKADIIACEQAIDREARRVTAMHAELQGFNYEFGVLVDKAEKAIAAHIESKEESLLEKTEFARTINGLVKNASEA